MLLESSHQMTIVRSTATDIYLVHLSQTLYGLSNGANRELGQARLHINSSLQAASAGVHVSLEPDGLQPLTVSCDAERIRSVLVNLLQNAIEAVAWGTTPGARREVLLSTQGGPAFAVVAVEDSGPGVAADVQEHLFEPFFTTKRNGTGLGLATAQRFAAAHGGHIELQRSSLGGARFVVRLPLHAPASSSEAA